MKRLSLLLSAIVIFACFGTLQAQGLVSYVYKSDATPQGVKELISKGANVNEQNEKGKTALMVAAFLGKAEIARVLIEQPTTDVNQQDNDGWTALMIAAYYGRPSRAEIVEDLVNAKESNGLPRTRIDLVNKKGQTAYDLAMLDPDHYHHGRIAEILEKAKRPSVIRKIVNAIKEEASAKK